MNAIDKLIAQMGDDERCQALRDFARCVNDAIPGKDLCPDHAEIVAQLTRPAIVVDPERTSRDKTE